jgi:signal transduction histidine kinase
MKEVMHKTKEYIYFLLVSGVFFLSLILYQWKAETVERENSLNQIAVLLETAKQADSGLEAELVYALKEQDRQKITTGREILARYGYVNSVSNFLFLSPIRFAIAAGLASFLTFLLGLGWTILHSKEQKRIRDLSEYLRELNKGNYRMRLNVKEDAFSALEDEMYKTMVLLREGQERMAEQKQSLADNLADIAHQAKTPLSSITLLCDLMIAQMEDHKTSSRSEVFHDCIQYTEYITEQTKRLTILVSGLLTLSRIDAGTLELDKKPIELQELIWAAKEGVQLFLEQKKQILNINSTDCVVMGDFYWLMQAIINLLKNCSEHTFVGGEISITCSDNPIYTKIEIADNGIGAAKEDLPHLFQRFYRGKNASKDSVGIGLALSKSIIEELNGEITAQNREGGGMRFIITLMKS